MEFQRLWHDLTKSSCDFPPTPAKKLSSNEFLSVDFPPALISCDIYCLTIIRGTVDFYRMSESMWQEKGVLQQTKQINDDLAIFVKGEVKECIICHCVKWKETKRPLLLLYLQCLHAVPRVCHRSTTAPLMFGGRRLQRLKGMLLAMEILWKPLSPRRSKFNARLMKHGKQTASAYNISFEIRYDLQHLYGQL